MAYFNSIEATLLAVEAGIGISILTKSSVNSFKMDHVVSLPFHPDVPAFFGAIGWREESLGTTAAKYLDIIKEIFPQPDYPLYILK